MNFVFDLQLAQQVKQMEISIENHMVMAVPDDIAELPCTSQSSQGLCRLKESYRFSLLSQPKRKSHTKKSATDNRPALARSLVHGLH